jgi:hypothetical protein
MNATTDPMNDPQAHITELSGWLTSHQAQRGTRAYQDRETSLQRWQAKAQLIAKAKAATCDVTKLFKAKLANLVKAKDVASLNALLKAHHGAPRCCQMIRVALRIAAKPEAQIHDGEFTLKTLFTLQNDDSFTREDIVLPTAEEF